MLIFYILALYPNSSKEIIIIIPIVYLINTIHNYSFRNSNVDNGGRALYKVRKIVNDINAKFGCIDGFKMMTKNLTIEGIKVIFEKMLKEHNASIVQKNQGMFHKQEHSILALISRNDSLTNQLLDSLSKDITDLKESLEFSQNEYDDKLKNMGDKVQKLQKEIYLMKEEQHVVQTTKPSWAIETDAKLADLEDRSRQNNLKFEGIK